LLDLVSDYFCLLQGDVSLLMSGTGRGRHRVGSLQGPNPL
jgi:hypothetical protein